MAVINYGQAPISIATTAVPFWSIKLHLSCFFLQVGTEFLRGVSGGERKRTNIGMELIIEPQLLFLDEPTTIASCLFGNVQTSVNFCAFPRMSNHKCTWSVGMTNQHA